ncbi:TetR/AcrR family transcriptional regulator C-terminal domain-containing protein [Yinghuangia seranimata]|uniref:TetR/AcrR family transcriptional regulator C-terminal domain-containing protein n=1 Tax=Yinghuangia seranimata TaxID=408067 RepID=UPI00248BB7B1|nr:TetR/AcrR family transcriptional regulator C-terminal domain-containing protein [Yinghuangia seranimata]MDI2127305.1 TetR/AcrR family transcriptional regulator C-terminal domain-containing protein [Yinghuangia seranimata]
MADRRARPRAGLSRDKVLDAAIAYVDEHGLAALSTRKLGTAMGVEGMTLYHYVPSKAALLDGMVERLLERAAGDLAARRDRPWPEALTGVAHALRATLLAHPAVLGVIATRPVNSPAAFRILESALAVQCEQGVPVGRALDTVNALTTFVIGHTLAEVGTTPGHEADAQEPEPVDADAYPYLAQALATGEGLDFTSRFATAVSILVRGFAAEG